MGSDPVLQKFKKKRKKEEKVGKGGGGGNGVELPDETFKLTSVNNFTKEIITFMWYSNYMFHCKFKAEFVNHALARSKSPVGLNGQTDRHLEAFQQLASLGTVEDEVVAA